MAFVFGRYANALFEGGPPVMYAVIAVTVLSVLNIMGVVFGKRTQNVLSLAKVLGLGAIVVAGFQAGNPQVFEQAPVAGKADIGLAMIFVLYAYGGWNDMAFVAAEMRNRRNIPRALLLGTLLITVIYLAVNAAYLLALGFDGSRQFDPPPVADRVLANLVGDWAGRGMSVLVMISALGAINGLIFAGSRVYSGLGSDWKLFAVLGRWHPKLGSPLWSLLAQGIITLTMIVAVGTDFGREAIDHALAQAGDQLLPGLGLGPLPWAQYYGGFGTLVAGTAPVFWIFFLLTGLSLFALRERDRDIKRPFSVPLFPVLPLIFCATCVFMLYSALAYAKALCLLGFIPLAVGLPLYYISGRTHRAEEPVKQPEPERTAAPPPLFTEPPSPVRHEAPPPVETFAPFSSPPPPSEPAPPAFEEPIVHSEPSAAPVEAAAPPEENPFAFGKPRSDHHE
jgi:amino acid transporter